MNGADFLLLVNTGTEADPVYEAVGSQRDASIDESNDSVDVSPKDSGTHRVIPGRYSSKISLDALYVPTDRAYLALRDACRDRVMILVARQVSELIIEYALAKVDTLSEEYPDQAEATISISLTVDDQWFVTSTAPQFGDNTYIEFENDTYIEWQ
jgi:TP901-1 family phage major tail protein